MTAGPLVFAQSVPTLGPESGPILDRLAEIMKANTDVAIRIESFTDNGGRPQNNLLLSRRRADAVRNALIARGVAAGQITAVGFGEARPIADNGTDPGRQQNRRVEFVVVRP